jgi:sulfur carrier protein ThiS
MRIHVHWTPRRPGLPDKQNVELPDTHPKISDLLDALEEPYEGVLAVRKDQPVPLDTPLAEGDEILLVRTVSGG